MRSINGILCGILAVAAIHSCSTVKYVPIEGKTEIVYRDSVIFHNDTISIEVPKEVIREIVPQFDTLVMETSVAKSISYVDTSLNVLRGELTNKPVKLEKEIQYVDRIVYRDSIVTQQIPVEVEKVVTKTPKWAWWALAFSILALLYTGLRIYLKFQRL